MSLVLLLQYTYSLYPTTHNIIFGNGHKRTHTHIYTHMYTYKHICTHIYIYVCTHIPSCTNKQTHTHTHTHTRRDCHLLGLKVGFDDTRLMEFARYVLYISYLPSPFALSLFSP